MNPWAACCRPRRVSTRRSASWKTCTAAAPFTPRRASRRASGMRQTITLTGETIARARVEELLAAEALLVFEACDFQQADLSRLNLQDCSFSNCAVLEASFYAAK